MTIAEAWQEIVYWIREYTGEDATMLILAIDAAIYLMIVNKDIRARIIVPLLALVPIIINPILYKHVYHDLRYWRFFWILPDTVLISLAVADICKRVQKQWVRCVSLIVIAGSLALLGTNMFLPTEENLFLPAESILKLTPETIEACKAIEEDNPDAKCIFTDYICIQARQYSPRFTQLYGRDVDGFIMGMDPEVREIADASWYVSKNKDPEKLFSYARDHGYTHCCLRTAEEADQVAERYGYSLLKQFGLYSIYHKV